MDDGSDGPERLGSLFVPVVTSFMLDGLNTVSTASTAPDDNRTTATNHRRTYSTSVDTSQAQGTRTRTNSTALRAKSHGMAGSSPYDRLEGGFGAQRGTASRKNWKKYAIIAVLVVGALWIMAPRSENYPWYRKNGESCSWSILS
jgi:guanosine-diphosphatase